MSDRIELFARLFAGRTDIYGALHGECLRGSVTVFYYEAHLFTSHCSLGIYPLVYKECKWGCSDIDVNDITQAWNLQRALKVLGLVSWVERSKSKGYHVWVFADDWVVAADMRPALLIAHHIAEVPPKEVNPKQTDGSDTPKGCGNYVNLPYPQGYNDVERRCVLNGSEDHFLSMQDFIDAAWTTRNTVKAIEAAASHRLLERTRKPIAYLSEVSFDEALRSKLSARTWVIVRDGPLPESDRSGTMFRLAHILAADGLTPEETKAALSYCDGTWGKGFLERPDGERYIDQMVEAAFSEHDDEQG